jgi:2-polyprenyl-6-methoxyphenol hydroxylase-like FAD-dependent oxidoreductase
MKVGIVGGGFAGLAAAIAFRDNGHEVTVFEKSSGPSAMGGAISLAPNALSCLKVLGVRKEVTTEPWSRMPASVRTPGGRILVRRSLGQLTGGGEFAAVTRAQLISWLAAELPSHCVHYSRNVTYVGLDGTIEISGVGQRFDLVVAADGLRSLARRSLWADAQPPRPTGITGWAWIVERRLETGFGVIWGRETEFGILPLIDGRTYVYGGDRSGQTDLRRFLDWPEPLPSLIDAATPEKMITPQIFEARPPRQLRRGKVCLIGDAAHCMRPTFGQGAALAMEDAIALAYGGPSRLSTRWPRMLTLYGLSKAGSRFAAPGTVPLERARNVALRLLPDPVFGVMAGSVSHWRVKPSLNTA